VETVCSTCGGENAPGAQFCWSCHAYLGWQDHPVASRTATGDPGPQQPRPPSGGSEEPPPDPFEAGVQEADLTLAVDGAPATVTVNIANTSAVVDGYVVEALDAPPWLAVSPGQLELLPGAQGVVAAGLRIASASLVPAQQLPVWLRVRNTTGRLAFRDIPVRVTVPVVDAPVEVRAEPRLLRAHDLSPAVCTVVVDNSRSNRWANVLLSAGDAEHVVRATWVSPQLQVPPGEQARTEVRFLAPPPGPGGEVSRTITVTAGDGRLSATTNVTLVQTASQAAIELLALWLDPTVLRLGGRRSGTVTAMVDNRRGAQPVVVSLRGDDPENSLVFTFSPATVRVEPGTVGYVRVTVRAPRALPGREVTRPLTIVASDGRTDTRVDGSVIQLASSRRGLARVLLTVLGGLSMVLGALLPFRSGSEESAVDLTAARVADAIDAGTLDAGGFEDAVSIGLALMVLAGLMVFGLTGRSGRLTRLSALLGAAVVIGSFVGLASLVEDGISPASGTVLALVGCVVGYVGGLLGRR